jgi:DNA-binding winged helix-turn-helix (wHTH) protein
LDLVSLHKKQKTLRQLIKALRKVLKAEGKYEGSLLATMDSHGVKLSELSDKPIVLHKGVTAPPKPRQRKEKEGPKVPRRRKARAPKKKQKNN